MPLVSTMGSKKAWEDPFILDSKAPVKPFKAFIMGQNNIASLAKEFPETADLLFEMIERDAREKYEGYQRLAK